MLWNIDADNNNNNNKILHPQACPIAPSRNLRRNHCARQTRTKYLSSRRNCPFYSLCLCLLVRSTNFPKHFCRCHGPMTPAPTPSHLHHYLIWTFFPLCVLSCTSSFAPIPTLSTPSISNPWARSSHPPSPSHPPYTPRF